MNKSAILLFVTVLVLSNLICSSHESLYGYNIKKELLRKPQSPLDTNMHQRFFRFFNRFVAKRERRMY